MDELLKKVAEIRGMPASLVERSAQARADKTGSTLEEVLTEWAGGEAAAPAAEEAEAPSEPEASTPEPVAKESAPAEAPSAETAVPGMITVDYLISLAAEAKRMPPRLIQSSAAARSEHSGESIESVLATWAGVDLDELKERAAEPAAAAAQSDPVAEEPPTQETPAEEAPAEEASASAAAPVAVAAAAAITLDELLEKVAEAKGMPASLSKRSAEARAKKTGESLEAVLIEWAGLDPDTVVGDSAAAPAAAPVAAAAPAEASEESASEESASEEAGSDPTEVEVIEGDAPDETADEVPDGTPTATSSRYPVWLTAAFVLIPILAVMYILIAPAGPDCGTGGQLLVDPSTGNAVNCDGSAYGTSTVDNFAAGAAVYTQCVACHGADGSGGVGPAFNNGAVLATFPADSCNDHIDWVAIGTGGWPDSTYGANAKPVGGGGVMPPFGTTLDEVALAQVVLYERVQFGGQDLNEAELDCGLVVEGESVEAAAG